LHGYQCALLKDNNSVMKTLRFSACVDDHTMPTTFSHSLMSCLIAILIGFTGGCAQATMPAIATVTRAGKITPYQTGSPTPTTTPRPPGTPTPLPSPSATPRTHVVVSGDELQIIARRYGIALDTLLSANPGINPLLLKVGAKLVIPAGTAAASSSLPTPTPVPLEIGQPGCSLTSEGELMCFISLHNNQPQAVENVSAVVRVFQPDGLILSKTALSPINLLPSGSSLALMAIFPSPVPQRYQTSAELLAAIPVSPGSARYLPASLENLRLDLFDSGLAADINATISLESGHPAARVVWVGAAAYSSSGRVVGVRRWESSIPLASGTRLPLMLRIYSIGEPIAKVEAVVEARP
jgi:LysM repeat protein